MASRVWQRWLIKLTNGIWLAAASLVVLLAVYVALGRSLLPLASLLQPELEELLGDSLGIPVRMEALRGGWDGFDPVISVRNFRLGEGAGDPEQAASFQMRDFRLRLNVWQSLRHRKLIFHNIQATGVGLTLRQNADGHWEVPGLASSEGARSDWEQIRRYLDQPNVRVAEVDLRLTNHQGEESLWHLSRAQMRDLSEGFEASGILLHPGSDRKLLSFALRGTGNPLAGGFQGLMYLDWQSGALLEPFLQAYRLSDVRFSSLESQGRAWLDFEAGQLRSVQGELHLDKVQWRTDELTIPPVENLGMHFVARRSDGGWRVAADHFEFLWRGEAWKSSSILMDARIDRSGQHEFWLRMDRLPVGLVSDLAQATQLLPLEGVTELAGRLPRGQLRNLRLHLTPWRSEQPRVRLDANLDQVALEPFRHAPGGSGIDGYISLTERQGLVQFQSQGMTVAFPEIFREGWRFAEGQGVVRWLPGEGGHTLVEGTGLRFRLAQGQGDISGSFAFQLGESGPSEPVPSRLRIDLTVKDMSAGQAKGFLPCVIIDGSICDWVGTNLLAGRIPQATYRFDGPVGQHAQGMPYISQLALQLKNASVRFHADWPQADKVDARMMLDGPDVDILIAKAQIAGTLLRDARVHIRPEPGRPLHVTATLATNLSGERLDYWLWHSPLTPHLQTIMTDWQVAGDYRVEIGLDIPLSDEPPHYRVGVNTENGSLGIPAAALQLEGLRGQLIYDSLAGLSGQGLRAEHLGSTVRFDLASPQWTAGHKRVRLRAQGHLALADLYRWREMAPVPGLEGETDYQADLELEIAEGVAAHLEITSNLRGIGSSWPHPFAKPAGTDWPLRYVHRFRSGETRSQAEVRLADRLNGRLWFEAGQYHAGVIEFSGPSPKAAEPEGGGTLLRGRLDRLDAQAWLDFLGSFNTPGGERQDQRELPLRLDLRIGELAFLGMRFDELELGLRRTGESWRLDLANRDQVKGWLAVPDREQEPLVARFEYLSLPLRTPGTATSTADPTKVPLLDLKLNALRLDGRDYGQWSLRTESRANGVVFKDITGRVGGADILGRISWLRDPQTQQDTTILTATLNGQRLEDFARHWGKTSSVTSDQMHFEFGLVWPAAPWNFAVAQASGSLELKLEKGSLRETGRSAEAVRIFGVLNMESIARRLKLDFSDLYEAGLSYDLMEGRASLERGVMRFEQPLTIKAPSSAYRITGQADLNQELLDMELVTILPVTKNLPLAALLVGAPQVGGALFLMDRLLGDPLSRLTSVTYHLRGSFDDPRLEIKNVFDAQGAPENLLGRSSASSEDRR